MKITFDFSKISENFSIHIFCAHNKQW